MRRRHALVLRELSQVIETEDAGLVAVGKVKIKGVAADDGSVVEREVVSHAVVSEDLLTRPLVDTACAGTVSP